MTPSSAQRLGQTTIRSWRANVAGTRASSQGTLPARLGGFRGICLPFPNELPRRYLWYGETRNGAGSGAPRARHEKKAHATTPLIHTTSRGNSARVKDTYRLVCVISWIPAHSPSSCSARQNIRPAKHTAIHHPNHVVGQVEQGLEP
jgi:hypothetical protein